VGALALPRHPGPAFKQLRPILGHLGLRRRAIPQQECSLPGCQAGTRALVVWPPVAAALGQALATQPEALSIRAQQFHRRRSAVAEAKDRPAEGMLTKHLAAYSGEPIDALTAIDGLGGEKEAALGGQLTHQGVSKKARTTASRGSCGSWAAIRRRAPSGRCSAISMSEVVRGHTGAAGTSTQPRAAVDVGVDRAAWWATQRFFTSPPLTRNRVATRAMENVVVQAMACSHRYWGMGSADVVRVWRQCSHRSATWVSWCSAGAGAMVFICASKVGVYLEILETDEASHITHARRKHTIHTSDEFEECLSDWKKHGLIIKYLSPYSPELNLIEILWRRIKYTWLPFSAYACLNALSEALETILSHVGSEYQITFA